ncbi:MAG: FecR domain-containing protein [Spirochaetales bacterium]|nr:FecR domain-containing protein [Spirochaetales bacterium]
MRRFFISFFLFLFLVPVFSQETIIVKNVRGKVEVKLPAQTWQPAKENMTLSKGTMIATGFKSEAVIDLGTSFVTVKPLTRMKLEELLRREDTIQTDIFLDFGKVTAEVKKTEGTKQDFKLKSPVSTAAVRGTIITYDMYSVFVKDGYCDFLNRLNQKRRIAAGEGSFTIGIDLPETTRENKRNTFWVSAVTGEELFPANRGPSATGDIVVVWE